MNFKKIFIRKIFSLKFKAKFDFSKKTSPEEKLSNLIDDLLADFKDPKRDISAYQLDFSKMTEIQLEKVAETEQEYKKAKKLTPEERLKAFKEKIKTKYKDNDDLFNEPNLNDSKQKAEPKKQKDSNVSDDEDLSEGVGLEGEENDEFNQKEKKEMDFDHFKNLKNNKNEKEAKNNNENVSKTKMTERKNEENQEKKSEEKKEENLFETSTKGLNYIPPNLVIKTLVFPKNKAEVLLLGVEKRNEHHASYMLDMLSRLKIDNIVTQLAPDEPFFIKTEDEYTLAWERFLRGKFEYKFVINPNPQNLTDLVLDSTRLKFLMDGSFLKSTSEFEMGSTFFYSKRVSTQKKEVDCFLTPLLYSYNNAGKMIPVIINDFPIILYREHIARNITLDELVPLFESYVEEMEKGNTNYDPTLIKPEVFIKPKIDYLTEVIKQTCYLGKKIMAIVDMNCAEHVAETWKNHQNHSKIENLQNLLTNLSNSKKIEKNLTFTDYIQKHVILDLLLDDFVQENFVEYKSFPFSGKGTIGRDMNFGNVFMIWNHFQRKYRRSKKKLRTFEDIQTRGEAVPGSFVDVEELNRIDKKLMKNKKLFKLKE